MKKDNEITLPTTSEIEELYKKAKYHKLFTEKIRSTVFMLIVVAAFAILVLCFTFQPSGSMGNP